jgi:hypothetical protein
MLPHLPAIIVIDAAKQHHREVIQGVQYINPTGDAALHAAPTAHEIFIAEELQHA